MNWRSVLRLLGFASLLGTAILLAVLWAASTTFVQVEARSSVVDIEPSPGAPIAWSLKDAQLLECGALRDAANRTGEAADKAHDESLVLDELASIELGADFDSKLRLLDTVQVGIVIDAGSVLVELRPLQRRADAAIPHSGGCSATPSRVAVLDRGDGTRRGLALPAQLRIQAKSLGEGLTLEFRGGLQVGREVTSSNQPLLTGGRLTLREVRARWLQKLVTNPHFEVDSRELGLGDKLSLRTPSGNDGTASLEGAAPRGFVRITPGERGIEMTVIASGQATRAEIVRPFSRPETPEINVLKVLSRDDLVQMLFALLVTVWSLGLALYPTLPEETGPAAGPTT